MRENQDDKMLKRVDAEIHKSANDGLSLILYFCLAQARRVCELKWQ